MDERWARIGMNGTREGGERRTTAAHPQEKNHIAADVHITVVPKGAFGTVINKNPTGTRAPGFLSDAVHEMGAPRAIATVRVAAVFGDDWPGFSSIIPHISP